MKLRSKNLKEEKIINKRKTVCIGLIQVLVMSGCATATKSTFLGVATGAAIGAASGAAIDSSDRGQAALTSALVGGIIGGITGYFTHGALETRDADVRQETLLNLEKFGVSGFSNTTSQYSDDNMIKQKVLIITDPNWRETKKGEQ